MNKHFEDTRYYLNRAAETTKEGVKEELDGIEQRFREATGAEEEPEPSRLEKIQDDLQDLEGRTQGEARRALSSARGRIQRYRSGE